MNATYQLIKRYREIIVTLDKIAEDLRMLDTDKVDGRKKATELGVQLESLGIDLQMVEYDVRRERREKAE